MLESRKILSQKKKKTHNLFWVRYRKVSRDSAPTVLQTDAAVGTDLPSHLVFGKMLWQE